MILPSAWTVKASRGVIVGVLAVASALIAAIDAEASAFPRTHESRQVVKPGSASNAIGTPRRKARPDMSSLRRRAAERRIRVEAEGRETPEAMRAIMKEFAQMERGFAGLHEAVNKHND